MPKNDLKRDPFLDELFKPSGRFSQAEVARRLSKPGRTVTRHAVNQWKRVPDHHVQAVADMGNWPLKKVRADLFDSEVRKNLAGAASPPTPEAEATAV